MQKRYIIHRILLCVLLITVSGNINNAAEKPIQVWKFAVISDTQSDNRDESDKSCINNEILNLISGDIAEHNPEFVLVSGDLVNGWFRNGGTDYAVQYSNWKNAMKPVYKRGIKIFAVRGNHDTGPERAALPPLPSYLEPTPESLALLEKEYRNAMIESYIPLNGPEKEKGLTYSFVYKNALIIGLDQYSGGDHKISQEWLDRELSVKSRKHLFVFGHEPAFGAVHVDNLSFYKKNRDRFWDSIGKAGGRMYFCGHDHFYNRSLIYDSSGNPVWQVINGTGGGRLQRWSGKYRESERVISEFHNGDYHGYILVTVSGPTVKAEWRALTDISRKKWQVLDTLTYTIYQLNHNSLHR